MEHIVYALCLERSTPNIKFCREPHQNYIDTRARSVRVSISFQGDINPIGP